MSSAPAQKRVAAIVLAAGSSTRMGQNKMLLELGAESVLRRAAKIAAAAGLDPVVVVTGHQAEEAEAQLAGLGCAVVHNAEHEVGIHTSVRVGIASLPESVHAAIVMLPDMPFVSAEMLRELVASYRGGDAPLVISRYGGQVNAPPMLYDRALFGELSVMQRRCGREVIRRHRSEALEVDWPEALLADLDTPEDYQRVVDKLAADELATDERAADELAGDSGA